MHPEKPLVSILTPTWNRAAYLERVWRGLDDQTYRHFEWIVCNDGSQDDTVAVVEALAAHSSFPVILVNADTRVGKARMDNEAVARARGEFILWNDSDDYLLPEALDRLVAAWSSIPMADRGGYMGITALCVDAQGAVTAGFPEEAGVDPVWNDLVGKFKASGDMVHFTRTSELRSHPFPEVDFVIPEGAIWTSLGHMRTRLHNEVLKIKEYGAPHCISFSGKMEYCRGRAVAMAMSESNLARYPQPLLDKLWMLITYIRCSLHGEIGLRSMRRLRGAGSPVALLFLMLPIGCLAAFKDRLQGKVRKTHREFIAASRTANITSRRLGKDDVYGSLHP